MTNQGPGPSKNERRTHARELARVTREAEKKRKRRQRVITQASIVTGALAVVAIVAVLIVNGTGGTASTAGPLNMLSDGLVVAGDGTEVTAVPTAAIAADAESVATTPADTSTVANIVVYLDYLCPYCNQFEATNTEQIQSWVATGSATLETHPISFLDNSSAGTKYSTRAANAVACVADEAPDSFLAMNAALFANQPAEQAAGLTDDDLIGLAADSGVTGSVIEKCINDETFADWVAAATTRAMDGPLPNTEVANIEGTPTVLVNGQKYAGAVDDSEAFAAFVQEVMAS